MSASNPGQPGSATTNQRESSAHEKLVATFLELACWDHHVHGKSDHRMYDKAAQRYLAQHPEIARANLYTAVVCGELAEVNRLLDEQPDLVNKPNGSRATNVPGEPRGWPPLLYLCYTRFTHQPAIDNAPAVARTLLDRGADSNAYYMAYDSRYTALVGVAGEGEQGSPRQPQAKELFQLLLDHGAEPFDIQVLYNTHFSGDVLWWLELIYEQSVKTGRQAAWADPNWMMLDMGAYGTGSQFLLNLAVRKQNLGLAEWCLTHGARPQSQNRPTDEKEAKAKNTDLDSLYHDARLWQQNEMAELFVRYGARPAELVLTDEEAFALAALKGNSREASRLLQRHPEYLADSRFIFSAAARDQIAVVEFLLELGVPLEISDGTNKRILHEAALNNSLRVAQLLIDRGAEIDPIEKSYMAPPIGWAVHADHQEMIDLLGKYSRNVWRLAFTGKVQRLREVLAEDPQLAKSINAEGITPLWWLPDDEAKAAEIVRLLVANGANPLHENIRGRTAADWARQRGMTQIEELLKSG